MKFNEETVRDKYRCITKKLIEKGMSITTMESMTAGMIASLITDTEGSSAVLKGAFVTYSNEAKIKNGVDKAIIERYSVYSRETAAAMAQACRKAYGADIGVGVTGTTGNVDPANAEASVPGQVYFAISHKEGTAVYFEELGVHSERYMYKLAAADKLAAALLEIIKDE